MYMDKIPVENLYSMFPSVERDVIDMIYSQYDSNIIDTLLEISESSETKKDEDNPKLKKSKKNNDNGGESEGEEKEINSSINNLLLEISLLT